MLDILIKKKLGKEDGVSGYIEDMIRRYDTSPANYYSRQMLNELNNQE